MQTVDEYGDKTAGGAKEFAYLSALLNVKPPAADNFKLDLFGGLEDGAAFAAGEFTFLHCLPWQHGGCAIEAAWARGREGMRGG